MGFSIFGIIFSVTPPDELPFEKKIQIVNSFKTP